MHDVELQTLGNGKLKERFGDAIQILLQNVQDPKTKAKQKRSIKITLDFVPDAARHIADVGIKVETKLAAHETEETTLFMSFDGARIVCTEQEIMEQDDLFKQ